MLRHMKSSWLIMRQVGIIRQMKCRRRMVWVNRILNTSIVWRAVVWWRKGCTMIRKLG